MLYFDDIDRACYDDRRPSAQFSVENGIFKTNDFTIILSPKWSSVRPAEGLICDLESPRADGSRPQLLINSILDAFPDDNELADVILKNYDGPSRTSSCIESFPGPWSTWPQ